MGDGGALSVASLSPAQLLRSVCAGVHENPRGGHTWQALGRAVGASSASRDEAQPLPTVAVPGYASSGVPGPEPLLPRVQGDVQDGQPAGPAPASPCGFIFMFVMVNGIEPFSINFSGHLDLFLFPFFFFF